MQGRSVPQRQPQGMGQTRPQGHPQTQRPSGNAAQGTRPRGADGRVPMPQGIPQPMPRQRQPQQRDMTPPRQPMPRREPEPTRMPATPGTPAAKMAAGGGESGIFACSVSEAVLVDAYNRERERNNGVAGYPDVHNPQALIDGIRKFVAETAQEKGVPVPVEVRFAITGRTSDESLGDAASDADATEYMAVIDDVTAANDGQTAYAVMMVRRDTMEMDAMSTITEEDVDWSADNMVETEHPRRTMLYIGFISMLAEKSPGYDRDQEPEDELSVEELMSDVGDMSAIPPDLISVGDNDLSLEPDAPDDMDAGDGVELDHDDTKGAGTSHNKKSNKQAEKENEEVIDDINVDFDELFS